MRVAIKDANVLIDLETAGLLDLWFQLDYETHVTSLIVGQITKGNHQEVFSYIEAGLIKVEQCSATFLEETLNLLDEVGNGPDLADCSVLLLAIKLNAVLLSGDAPLRKIAKTHNVEVRGTIWIFDQLLKHDLLVPKVAAQKLKHLLRLNRFLPKDICEQRISSWLECE